MIYNKKVKVEESEIRDQLEKIIKSNSSNVELKLSEIQILSTGDEIKDQQSIKSIKDQINEFGFGITALRNSISSSSKQNGNLGWINMRSFSKKIYKILNKMNVGDVSSPIISSNNILFLKIMDKRVSKPDEIDKSKLKKDLENQRKNELFTLYSNSHLSKIKNKIFIYNINNEKKILIVSGDPNSINSELIFKTWKKLNKVEKKKIYLISNSNLLRKQF